jgi:hypothetical protein
MVHVTRRQSITLIVGAVGWPLLTGAQQPWCRWLALSAVGRSTGRRATQPHSAKVSAKPGEVIE